MGQLVVLHALRDGAHFQVASRLEHSGFDKQAMAIPLSVPLQNLPEITSNAESAVALADVVVDFSAPAAVLELAPLCREALVPYLVASTGLTTAQQDVLKEASKTIPILHASNLSVGVTVMQALVEFAAKSLGEAFDVEVVELHHRRKRDAPSGTALTLAEAVRRGQREALRPVFDRCLTKGPRANDELGMAAVRGGDIVGEHTVYFLGEGERLEITHRATSPDVFALGALRAASFLASSVAPGLYNLSDVVMLDEFA